MQCLYAFIFGIVVQQISDLKEELHGMQKKLVALREENKQLQMVTITQRQELNQLKLLAAHTTGL